MKKSIVVLIALFSLSTVCFSETIDQENERLAHHEFSDTNNNVESQIQQLQSDVDELKSNSDY